jgi:putative ABC transport system permease protein
MPSLAKLFDRLLRRGDDADLDAELEHHVAAHAERLIHEGLAPDEARRRALADLGGLEPVKERCRDERRGAVLGTLGLDLRYGARLLRRSPGFTAVAVGTIAAGVSVSAVLFSLADAALLRPLPFPDPDRLVALWDVNEEQSIPRTGVTTGNLIDWRRDNQTLAALAGWYVMGRTVRGEDDAQVVVTAQVSEDFFSVFPVRPLLGRTFTPEETRRSLFSSAAAPVGADPVALLSEGLWRSRFQGNPAIEGKTISIERRMFRVVGVLPDGFAIPEPGVSLWMPWGFDGTPPRDQHYVRAAARLKRDVTLDAARRDLDALAESLERDHPDTNRGWRVALAPLQDDLVGPARPTLLVMLAGVALILVVAGANIAGLQMARALARGRETAVRKALGASGLRLARQHLTESALLALAGGAAGLALAAWGLSALRTLGPSGIPRLAEARLDLRVVLFAAAVTTLTGLLFGLTPLLAEARRGEAPLLHQAGRGVVGAGTRRWRKVLVATQVTVACVLLTAAGLLTRTYARLLAVDPGFSSDHVLVLPIFLDAQAYGSGAKTRAYYGSLLQRLAAVPGVTHAGGATALPTSPLGPDFERPVWADGSPEGAASARPADVRIVTPGYFETLRIAVLRGRRFDERDASDAPLVVMVNRALARQMWGDQDPVGRRMVVDYSTAGTYPYEVIGVVDDVKFRGLRSEPRAEIYMPHAQRPYLVLNIAVRTHDDPVAMIPAIRQALRDVDPLQPAHSIMPLDALVKATVARDRLATMVVLGFAAAALALSLMGLYGVLSYMVGQRVPEFGVRLALGAHPGHLVGAVVSEAGRILVAGLGLGLAAALAITPLLQSVLFGVGAHDAATFILAPALLALAALAAAWIPARRAARVDPLTALRHE